MTDTHPIVASCPQCGHVFSHVGSLDGSDTKAPEEGDFTVCIRCGEILQHDSTGAVDRADPAEWTKLELVQPGDHAALLAYQRKIRRVATMLRFESRGSA